MKTRIYAIGDIHGRLDLLEQLYERIAVHARAHKAERRVLLHLGDYVDRGPDSKGVIERVRRGLPGFENIALIGNHEALMLDYLDDPEGGYDYWLDEGLGGAETLRSFGLDPFESPPDLDKAKAAIGVNILEWLHALKFYHREGGFYFVHAGVMPGVALENQNEESQIWIRNRFTESDEDFGARVVHGHSPTDEPEIKRNRIGLDTGAVWTGRLTAAVLDPERPDDYPLLITATGEPSREPKKSRR